MVLPRCKTAELVPHQSWPLLSVLHCPPDTGHHRPSRQSSQLLPRPVSAARPPATGHDLPNHSSPPTSSASPLLAAPIPTILWPISSLKNSGSTGYLSSSSYKIRAFLVLPASTRVHFCLCRAPWSTMDARSGEGVGLRCEGKGRERKRLEGWGRTEMRKRSCKILILWLDKKRCTEGCIPSG